MKLLKLTMLATLDGGPTFKTVAINPKKIQAVAPATPGDWHSSVQSTVFLTQRSFNVSEPADHIIQCLEMLQDTPE